MHDLLLDGACQTQQPIPPASALPRVCAAADCTPSSYELFSLSESSLSLPVRARLLPKRNKATFHVF